MVPDCRFASLVWCVSLVLGLWNPPGWAQPLPLVLIVGWVTQGKLLGGRESVLWMWTAPLCGPDSYLTVLCLGPRQKNAGNDSPTWSGFVGGGGATRARVCSPPALGSRRLIWGCSEPQLFVGAGPPPPGPSWQLVPGPGRALTTCGLFLLLVLLQFYGFHVPSHFIFKFYCREHCRASPKLT